MKFVIIGGDAAGLSAASRAKRAKPELEVTVLEQSEDVSYSACGMPYNIADPDRDIQELVVRRAEVFREKQGIDLRTGHRVDRIDREARTVSGRSAEGDFELPWDRLLIATGASSIIPAIPGVELPGVFSLKVLADGGRIKQWLREGQDRIRRCVVVGSGYIGLEMCEALRARGLEVAVVKPRPRLLPWLAEELVAEVRSELERQGVELHFGEGVEAIESAAEGLLLKTSERELAAEMVLFAIGVQPNNELAVDAGLDLGAGQAVAVDRSLRTSDPEIFAAGDCADAFHIVSGERVWIPLALRANRAGWAVADMVTGRGEPHLSGIAGTAVFKVFDLQVARTGLSEAEAKAAGFEPAAVTIRSRSRAHSHPGSSPIWVQMVGDRASGRLLGCQMVGREGAAHRINAPAVALHAAMTVADYAQIDAAYAPPFGPTWDPTLVAANQLLKKL